MTTVTARSADLAALLARLPSESTATRSQTTVNGFLVAADDERLMLVVGHLRLTIDPDDVLDLEPLDPASGPVTVPAVRATIALPVTVADLSESVPDDVVLVADRPFAIATRPLSPTDGHSPDYRAREAAFLAARGIGPTDP